MGPIDKDQYSSTQLQDESARARNEADQSHPRRASFSDIPPEVIFDHLLPVLADKDVSSLSQTSKELNSICVSPHKHSLSVIVLFANAIFRETGGFATHALKLQQKLTKYEVCRIILVSPHSPDLLIQPPLPSSTSRHPRMV